MGTVCIYIHCMQNQTSSFSQDNILSSPPARVHDLALHGRILHPCASLGYAHTRTSFARIKMLKQLAKERSFPSLPTQGAKASHISERKQRRQQQLRHCQRLLCGAEAGMMPRGDCESTGSSAMRRAARVGTSASVRVGTSASVPVAVAAVAEGGWGKRSWVWEESASPRVNVQVDG
jgi:hypothetical protein